jgi:hypothetical protein
MAGNRGSGSIRLSGLSYAKLLSIQESVLMKNLFRILIPILLASVACSLAVSTPDKPSDNRPVIREDRPAIAFLNPVTGDKYALGTQIILYAEARDLGAGIARVEFYDNFDALIGTVNAASPAGVPSLSARYTWQPLSAQIHFIKAKAIRADGTESPLQEIQIEVVEVGPVPTAPPSPIPSNETTPPQVTEEAVSQGERQSQPVTPAVAGSVTLQAVVSVEVVQVRVRPDQTAEIAGLLSSGQTIPLVGRSADNLWYATPMQTGGYGWVFGNLLQISGDPSTLPLVTTQ